MPRGSLKLWKLVTDDSFIALWSEVSEWWLALHDVWSWAFIVLTGCCWRYLQIMVVVQCEWCFHGASPHQTLCSIKHCPSTSSTKIAVALKAVHLHFKGLLMCLFMMHRSSWPLLLTHWRTVQALAVVITSNLRVHKGRRRCCSIHWNQREQ